MTAPAVRIRGLHMLFPVRWGRPIYALKGIDLDVPVGSVFGLLGPNGCGKTTMLSCLLGLLWPHAGELQIAGRTVGRDRFDANARPYGVLLEDTRLPPFLTVGEALTTLAVLRGFDAQAAAREVERVTETCGVQGLRARHVGVLSKGQARRVGLAAALIGDPPLLLLDEPSSGLDVAARVEFESMLRALNDGRRTVVLASHFLGDVQNTCTHVAIMRDGRILGTGRTAEIIGGGEGAGVSASDVYVDASAEARLVELGLESGVSRYEGLRRVVSPLGDDELLRVLLGAGIVPRRMEPRVSLLSVYLSLTAEDTPAEDALQ
jgi:ABC-2 type transport system ATP-binding protein